MSSYYHSRNVITTITVIIIIFNLIGCRNIEKNISFLRVHGPQHYQINPLTGEIIAIIDYAELSDEEEFDSQLSYTDESSDETTDDENIAHV